ncbi:hypothetical protein [Deferrisoma camini]|uniref:hypothetical protein n=1 Tax=Deferrisoma camini TaxID=1035120 RepID=UPI00046C8EC8|nr:hypothetical protein [Deferrisoma camini]
MDKREIYLELMRRGVTAEQIAVEVGCDSSVVQRIIRLGRPGRPGTKGHAAAHRIAEVIERPFDEVWGKEAA